VDVRRQVTARVLERRHAPLHVQVRRGGVVEERAGRRGQAQVRPGRVVDLLGGTEQRQPTGGADQPVAEPAERARHGEQARPEGRGVGLGERQGAVAERRPRRPAGLADEPDAEAQLVAQHGVGGALGQVAAEVVRTGHGLADEDLGERPADDLGARQVPQVGEVVVELALAEVDGLVVSDGHEAWAADAMIAAVVEPPS